MKQPSWLFSDREHGIHPVKEHGIYSVQENKLNNLTLAETKSIFTFSPQAITQLENIIYQCPLAGGRGVYGARALYSWVNDTLVYLTDSLNCSQLGLSWRKPQPKAEADFSIVPNPGMDKVKVTWDKKRDLITGIAIYTMIGTEVTYVRVEENTGEINLNTSSLSQGFYVFHFKNEQGEWIKKVKFIKE
ncbi:MAG: T9SS type A sorting domain-containing protein [Bacteroidia bacterium]|nr:T9SS type A sorting domain-containing protein [Bacteroidia bacterium]